MRTIVVLNMLAIALCLLLSPTYAQDSENEETAPVADGGQGPPLGVVQTPDEAPDAPAQPPHAGALEAIIAPMLLGTADSEDAGADLAKKLANPVASLISVPVQANYDDNIGPGDEGSRLTVNIQPVIPFKLNEDWNLISRTILPVIDQNDVPVGTDKTGIGDVLQSLFFSPAEPTAGGLVWGAGPVFLFPTASDELLGGEKWGIGPTAVGLKQSGPWTYGALVNHLWSFAGEDDRADINNTFIQPFVTYTTATAFGVSLSAESSYNWDTENWSVPVNLSVSQMLSIGNQPVSIQAGVRYWLESPDTGAEDWGFRLVFTLLFPR
jgi:hypothetical protein